ncbi:MAG: DUF2283 domain-containing protein [Geminicoccaceae bacterium]
MDRGCASAQASNRRLPAFGLLEAHPETHSLYIELKPGPGTETREVAEGLVVDLNAAGEVVGFDIDHASEQLDLTTLETVALPFRSTRAA